jgi:hypothetical protein
MLMVAVYVLVNHVPQEVLVALHTFPVMLVGAALDFASQT